MRERQGKKIKETNRRFFVYAVENIIRLRVNPFDDLYNAAVLWQIM